MFKTRLISGILLVIAALLTIISGNYVLFVTLLCVSLLGMQELYKAMGVHKEQTEFLELAGYLGAILYYVSLLLGFERYGTMADSDRSDPDHVCICFFVSEVQCRSGHGNIFRSSLCSGNAFFYSSDKKSSGW